MELRLGPYTTQVARADWPRNLNSTVPDWAGATEVEAANRSMKTVRIIRPGSRNLEWEPVLKRVFHSGRELLAYDQSKLEEFVLADSAQSVPQPLMRKSMLNFDL